MQLGMGLLCIDNFREIQMNNNLIICYIKSDDNFELIPSFGQLKTPFGIKYDMSSNFKFTRYNEYSQIETQHTSKKKILMTILTTITLSIKEKSIIYEKKIFEEDNFIMIEK